MSHSNMVTITPQNRFEEDRNACQRIKLTFALILFEFIFIALFGVFLRYDDVAMPMGKTSHRYLNRGGGSTPENYTTTLPPGSVAPGNGSTVTTESISTVTTTSPSTASTTPGVTTTMSVLDQVEHLLATERHVNNYYPIFEDIHVMMFVGFGFVMTYLYRYGLSGISYNFLLGSMCIQWATLTAGWIRKLKDQPKGDYYHFVGINTMLDADYAVCAALVAFGAVLGKVSLLQLVIMAFCLIPAYEVNCLMIYDLLAANDPGYSMTVHLFGALFGLIVSRIIHRKETEHEDSKKAASVYHSDLFAMIGTLFLWTLYPSFNSAFAKNDARIRAIINTYYALTASVMATFALTHLFNKEKFSMLQVQNATIAGGVAVGTIAGMIIQPWGAILTGFIAGVVSTMSYQYITPCLKRIGLHDTCGVFSLHLLPALISAFGSILAAGVATQHKYGDYSLAEIFKPGRNTVGKQAGYQAAALAVSIGTAIVSAILTGTLLKLPIWDQPQYDDILDDEPRFVTVADIPGQTTYRIRDDIIASSKPTHAVTEFQTEYQTKET